MNVRPEVVEVVRAWVRKADADYDVAVHELSRGEKAPIDIICFHAQQAVEKTVKALLVVHDIQPPKSHELERLFGLLPAQLGIHVEAKELNRASQYAVTPRYPDLPEALTREDAEWAVRFAGSIRDRIRPLLPIAQP